MERNPLSIHHWVKLAKEAHFNSRELARLCNLSPRHLQRELNKRFGRTPQDWLNEQRIIASHYLLTSGQPVKNVAFELGFKQPSHFCRQFKSVFSITPSQFVRTQMRNEYFCRS